MCKETLVLLFSFALCTRVNSEANWDKKHSYTDRPEEVKNVPPLMTVQIGNPVHITKREQNNNFYLIPISQPNLSIQTLDVHRYDPNTNILRTIIIIPPKMKKPCDLNSSVSQPPVQTEKPTKSPACNNITATKKPPTTIKPTTVSQITKKSCKLTTKDILAIPPTEIIQTPATKVRPNPNEVTANLNEVTSNPNEVSANLNEVTANPNVVTPKPNEVTPTPNEITPTPTIDRITRAPIIGEPDGESMKCLQDGVYRANSITCDQFYVCIQGIRYLMDCPYGLVFNNQLKICDWLENVSDCKPPAFKDFTCPDEGYGADDNLILQFRYRDSCSQYVACHKRKPRLLTCDSGYYFHDESSTCMTFRSVSNCKDVWYSY